LKELDNSSKGKEVVQTTVDWITENVKAFYRNPDNRYYALNAAKNNIGTTKMIQDDVENGQMYAFTFQTEDWKNWYNELNKAYNYDKDNIILYKDSI